MINDFLNQIFFIFVFVYLNNIYNYYTQKSDKIKKVARFLSYFCFDFWIIIYNTINSLLTYKLNMILIYILSMLSLSSLYVDKSEPIQVEQWQEIIDNNEIISTEPKKVSKSNQIDNSWENNPTENISLETGVENSEILENSTDEEYEEIIFQDNFDKEYRSWTEDNYLED